MTQEANAKPEPQTFADLANQPSGSGVAAEQAAFMEAALEEASADTSITAGNAEELAAYTDDVTPTEGGPGEAESASHPS